MFWSTQNRVKSKTYAREDGYKCWIQENEIWKGKIKSNERAQVITQASRLVLIDRISEIWKKMKVDIWIHIAIVMFCYCVALSKQNSTSDIFKAVIRVKERLFEATINIHPLERRCDLVTGCDPTECCVLVQGKRSSGICMKRPSLGERCGLSASFLSCPCIKGTTCSAQRIDRSSFRRKHSFRCKYVKFEQEEIAENWLLV